MQINYQAGPTAAKFHSGSKIVRGFMGPVGNGKSVACIMEMLRLAREQWPNSSGLRKTRWAIIRNTNPELRTTTLNTWKQWIPEQICPIVMHPIITCNLIQPIKQDRTVIDMEVYFLALDRPEDVKKLLSMELTGVFINEAREMPYAIVKGARERIGRYPAAIDGYTSTDDYTAPKDICRRKCLLMDTNPPDTDHWWYQLAEEGCLKKAENKDIARKQTAEIFEFYRGPSPLIGNGDGTYADNPAAENIKYLPGGYQYYHDMIAGNTFDHINVQVLGNYGAIQDGLPVYPQYNDRIHCAVNHFVHIQGISICLGWDFGLTPACVVGQLSDTGQARIIAELTADVGGDIGGIRQFARDIVKPFLQKHFSKCQIGFSLGDPAGNNRGEGEGKSAIGILNDDYVCDGDTPLDMGFTTEKAPTNDITRRLDAVRGFLIKMVGKGDPGIVIDKRCVVIRKGFQGAYRHKRIAMTGTEERYRDTPDKNDFSHPHDALQYLCCGFAGGYVQDVSESNEYYEETNETGYW